MSNRKLVLENESVPYCFWLVVEFVKLKNYLLESSSDDDSFGNCFRDVRNSFVKSEGFVSSCQLVGSCLHMTSYPIRNPVSSAKYVFRISVKAMKWCFKKLFFGRV